ncbi:MAG TPA: glycosyltransferase family A protein [Allosphingosinicella sp.]|nr:glycosyltransferase family A protein [Allosphingosinicella sp.]
MKKISCLMVSRPRAARLPLLRRSLESYAMQSYPHRELVVVIDVRASAAERAGLLEAVEAIVPAPVRLVAPEPERTLGALRNISIAEASGDVLCQWDDDDIQHPDRLAAQYDRMREAGCGVSYLVDTMLFHVGERKMCWTNWAQAPTGAHPGTLMCEAGLVAAYPEEGPLAQLSEDVTVLQELERRGPILRLAGVPHLYVYVTHPANTTTAEHHDRLARELGISRGLLLRREAALRESLGAIDFGGEVSVEGPNGPAFRI